MLPAIDCLPRCRWHAACEGIDMNQAQLALALNAGVEPRRQLRQPMRLRHQRPGRPTQARREPIEILGMLVQPPACCMPHVEFRTKDACARQHPTLFRRSCRP